MGQGVFQDTNVREHIPLEQGLRPFAASSFWNWAFAGQRAYSIRTRIKTLYYGTKVHSPPCVREHIPLEQGLRLANGVRFSRVHGRQRAYSIRTRIKT